MVASYEPNNNEKSIAIARALDAYGADDTLALDISEQSGFADCFVLASAPSQGRLRGLYRKTHETLSDLGLEPRQSHKRNDDSGWLLIDCDGIVIHLMLEELRRFYELENLWYDATVLFRTERSEDGDRSNRDKTDGDV